MSVLQKNRGESPMQFIDTARELEIFTLRYCAKFPKRYTFLITNELVRLSQSIYNHVKAANSIYPMTSADVEARRAHLIDAQCDLQCLISQLDIAKEMFVTEVKSSIWCEWIRLITQEIKLISALKKKDKERYKELP